MALDKSGLIADLKNIRKVLSEITDKDEADEKATQLLADAIEKFVKSGEVVFTAGEVTGQTPANGTLVNGAATGGEII